MILRAHQSEAKRIGAAIRSGLDQKFTVAYVTPGGGKTLLASLFAHELLKGDVMRVLVLCPRTTLQAQMREGFHVPSLGLNGSLSLGYQSTTSLLREGMDGCVTTYQDVIEHPRRWLRVVSELPTLLVLDEAHHLQAPGWGGSPDDAEDSGWTSAVAPLVSSARRVLLMTGTLKRENGSPIAFVEYDADRKPMAHVRYTRRDALGERAILNVSAKLCDGEAAYWHRFNKHEHSLSKVSAKEESRALATLLKDADYRNRVLDMALDDFALYRSNRNPTARMIVICADQRQARSVAAHVRAKSYDAVLAIQSEPHAHRRIARFRDKREGQVLVTCQMAYEGLDVPDCTHLVALTNFRSRPWLEQALSRVTRFDPKCGLSWDDQCAYLYVPSDPSMVAFLSEWLDEQDASFSDPPEPLPAGAERPKRTTFIPESGELTEVLHADTFGVYAEPDQRRLRALDEEFPYLSTHPTMHRLKVARRLWPDDALIPGGGVA